MSHTSSEAAGSADREYFEFLADGQFMIPLCQACNRHHFFPRVICPHCGADSLRWVSPSGQGTVYATTTVRGKNGSHNVCLVDLDEGPRLMNTVVDTDSERVAIGLRVRARVARQDGQPLLVFSATEAP